MKVRAVAAVVGLVIGVVALTRAQEPPAPPRPPADAKAVERVAKLRGELEVLQLEYDAERNYLLEAIRELRVAEQLNHEGNPNLRQLAASIALGTAKSEVGKAIDEAVAKGQTRTQAALQHVVATERKRLEATKLYLARAKQEFARLGQALAEKQEAFAEATKGTVGRAL